MQAPGPAQPWDGVLNATNSKGRCPQVTVDVGNKTNMFDWTKASDNEDCLYLSVYTPIPLEGMNLPVLVFIHGGAFISGSNIFYEGYKFMDYNIVLVVPNYRLGPIGFLSLDNDEIPGNAGMIDQAVALQWVNDHISVFGGDTSRITIMATTIWGIDYNNIYAATETGRLLNCPELDIPNLTTCLQNAETLDLLKAHAEFQSNEVAAGRNPFAGTSPVIQKAGSVIFLDRDPREILRTGNHTAHRALLGSNKHEGTLVFSVLNNGYILKNNLTDNEEFLKREFTTVMLDFFNIRDQGESIAAMVEKAHFGQANMGNYTAMTPGIVDYLSNMFLKGPVYEDALYNSKVADTYLYAFHYFGDRSVFNIIADPNAIEGGVCHANEIPLQFNIPAMILSGRDRAMSKTFLDMWVNFITYGNPTPMSNPVEGVPTWPLFDGTTRNGLYMRINDTCYGPMLDIPGLGTVMGDTDTSYVNDRLYYRYRGMPFATQPVGPQYRYKVRYLVAYACQNPVQPWQGVYNATQIGNRCPQVTVDLGNKSHPFDWTRASETEDCLYLSVYTPTTDGAANLPVLVFWHGGAFESGSGIIYDGKKFMDYDVILVVPHYRLGPIGFLSLDTDDIPGNAGMLDQVEALKWVKNHIRVFGGNPNQITIMGESAGAASVSLHNISPLSNGIKAN
ncbi:hypothetical protein B566_EDAN003023 [Ephemera danica]|nr:hypothetical protein B566_EDAN003023 [Ephemera danica]